jgi:hypothetical protein
VFLHPANARLEFADLTHRASRMSQTRGGLPADYLSLAPDRAVSLATPAAVRHYQTQEMFQILDPADTMRVRRCYGSGYSLHPGRRCPGKRRAGGGSVNQAARETGGGGGTP